MEDKQRQSSCSSVSSKAEKVFRNDLILKLIAQHMSVTDIRALRVTCTTWNWTFLPSLRDKQPVLQLACCRKKGPDAPPDYWTSKPGHTMENWTKIMGEDIKKAPVTKYRLIDIHSAPVAEAMDFFRKFGPTMRSLDLQLSRTFDTMEDTINIGLLKWIIFEQTPNLVELTLMMGSWDHGIASVSAVPVSLAQDIPNLRRLEICIERNVNLHPALKDLLQDLSQHVTGLEFLTLGNKYGTDFSDVRAMLEQLNAHPAAPLCLAKLTTLKVHQLGVQELEVLLQLARNIRLTSFSVSTKYTDEQFPRIKALLYEFLEAQASTLRHISLELKSGQFMNSEAPLWASKRLDFPIMPAVRRFDYCLRAAAHTQDLDDSDGQLLVRPLQEIFPGLIKLFYTNTTNRKSETAEEDQMENFQHAGVTELTLDTKFMPGTRFSGVFGNGLGFQLHLITQLKIKLEPTSVGVGLFTQICATMPALEVLIVKFINEEKRRPCKQMEGVLVDGSVLELDSLLSGVLKHNLEELQQILEALELNELAFNVDSLRSCMAGYKMDPGLQDLRSLKKFVLEFYECRFRLTDLGGYFGLAVATRTLQHIEIALIEHVKAGYAFSSHYQRRECRGDGESADNAVSGKCEAMLRSVFTLPGTAIRL